MKIVINQTDDGMTDFSFEETMKRNNIGECEVRVRGKGHSKKQAVKSALQQLDLLEESLDTIRDKVKEVYYDD